MLKSTTKEETQEKIVTEEPEETEEKVEFDIEVSVPQLITSAFTAIGAHKLLSGIEKTTLQSSNVGVISTIGLAVFHTLAVTTAAVKGWHFGEIFKNVRKDDDEEEEK